LISPAPPFHANKNKVVGSPSQNSSSLVSPMVGGAIARPLPCGCGEGRYIRTSCIFLASIRWTWQGVEKNAQLKALMNICQKTLKQLKISLVQEETT
ncbi:unnamed protein product, partial [Urochloa humidicola]